MTLPELPQTMKVDRLLTTTVVSTHATQLSSNDGVSTSFCAPSKKSALVQQPQSQNKVCLCRWIDEPVEDFFSSQTEGSGYAATGAELRCMSGYHCRGQ